MVLQRLDRDYAKKKLKERKGYCKKCGRCCRGCKHLDVKTNLCKIYAKRPWICYKEFPLDKLDQQIWGVEKVCGYTFKK